MHRTPQKCCPPSSPSAEQCTRCSPESSSDCSLLLEEALSTRLRSLLHGPTAPTYISMYLVESSETRLFLLL